MRGEWKVEGGTVIGLVSDQQPVKETPKTEDAPKKRTRKTKGDRE